MKVKVYACRYCDLISTNPHDFIGIALDNSDLLEFGDWVNNQYHRADMLVECLEDALDYDITLRDFLGQLHEVYDRDMQKDIVTLFEDASCDEFYCSEIEIAVN
jgi:hypothetical protein